MWVLKSTTASQESSTTVKQSKAKLHVANKSDITRLDAQSLFAANPRAALPLLSMIGQAQFSIDDLLGQLSRQFIEQLHKIRNVTERLPKERAEQVRWLMKQAFKLKTLIDGLRPHPQQLKKTA